MRIFVKVKKSKSPLNIPVGYIIDNKPMASDFIIEYGEVYEIVLMKYKYSSQINSENLVARKVGDKHFTPLYLNIETLKHNLGDGKLLSDVTDQVIRNEKINSIIS